MPLKIVHHKELQAETKKDKPPLSVEESVIKMFTFCKNVIDVSNSVVETAMSFNYLPGIVGDKEEKKKYGDKNMQKHGRCVENGEDVKNKGFAKAMDLFCLIAGEKSSPLEAMSKITSIIQKINVLANDFGISLSNKIDEETDVLTDDDIDVMVQMVKDFGEKQIREDAKECCEKAAVRQSLEEKQKTSAIDVYDVYHKN